MEKIILVVVVGNLLITAILALRFERRFDYDRKGSITRILAGIQRRLTTGRKKV